MVRTPRLETILLLADAAFGFAAFWAPQIGRLGFGLCTLALAGVVIWRLVDRNAASRRWLARASVRPIVLAPPFEDRWRVAAGGPDPRHNHHRGLSDQFFAYDFVRVAGESWDAPVLAPCGGMIVHVENRQDDATPDEARRSRGRPFGNYVSIDTGRGFVLLAHLRKGSVTVRVGERVRAGDPIGRCGNSGSTHRSHLHVHAQTQSSEAIATADGIPVAFLDRGAKEPMLLEYGDELG
jgi:murein DD-endopeptidase MepM/ murein hydrolase activator NlpD